MTDLIERRKDYLLSKRGQDELWEVLTNLPVPILDEMLDVLQKALVEPKKAAAFIYEIGLLLDEHCLEWAERNRDQYVEHRL